MTYTKPEVRAIGQAVQVIENYPAQGPMKFHVNTDGSQTTNPAYDLDE